MYAKITCQQCTKTLKVRQEHAGRTVRCPYCHSNIQIPSQLVEEQPAAPRQEPNRQFQIDTSPAARGKSGPVVAPAARRKSPAAATPSAPRHSTDQTGTDEAGLATSGLIALATSVVFLAAVYPLRQFTVVQLFWDRGFVPFVLVLLMGWSLVILFFKWRRLGRQREAMLLDVLPTEVSTDITPDSLDQFVDHIHSLPVHSGESMLVNRVLRGLGHFRVRKSAAETVTMMESQSAIDANSVASSYTLVKVFLWSLPILGFIGTVIGISQAVAGLAGSLESASDVSAIKGSLNSVFAGLGTAFDTTLLALVMSLVVKVLASALQKSEEDLVTWVDEYCNENLLKRLDDGRQGGAERGSGGNLEPMRKAIEAALAAQQAELEAWKRKLEVIGKDITTQVAHGWSEISLQFAQQLQQQVAQWRTEQEQHLVQWTQQMATLGAAAEQIQQTLLSTSEQTAALPGQFNESLTRVTENLEPQFSGLQLGLNNLSDVLQRLGEQQVIVQQVESPRGRWFWQNGKAKGVNTRTGHD